MTDDEFLASMEYLGTPAESLVFDMLFDGLDEDPYRVVLLIKLFNQAEELARKTDIARAILYVVRFKPAESLLVEQGIYTAEDFKKWESEGFFKLQPGQIESLINE